MKTVFFDVDTQVDFMLPAGALYVPGAERILPAIAQLNRHAPLLVSTTDAHAEDDPEFQTWPGHCIRGTAGQSKPAGTLLRGRVVVPCERVVHDFTNAPQYIIEKTKLDAFSNPNLLQLLHALDADRYVVYGVVTEYCVRFAAMGLLRLGKPVDLVSDAVMSLSGEARDRTMEEFTAAGGRTVSLETVLSRYSTATRLA